MLSETLIQHIRQDLTDAGISMPDLLEDLLDHLCTSIEADMTQGYCFEEAYEKACQMVMPLGAENIQREATFILTYPNFIKMRKMLLFASALWASVSLFAMLFNILHWPGAHVLIQTSGLLLGGFLLPVFLTFMIREGRKRDWLEWSVLLVGWLCSVMVCGGAVFKMYHWPGANIMLISSLFLLASVFIPLTAFRWYRTVSAAPVQG
ncbi:MAG: hypothetical protein AAF206_12375 [Bacteroidota bacterium]